MEIPLKEIVTEIRTLEPFPQVATRVLELSSQEQVVPGELMEVIQLDPVLTAKVLRLCNSAYYGFQREIASLTEAGNLLGVTTLVNLVLTTSASKYFRNYGQATSRSQRTLWESSVTNALAGRMIAQHNGDSDPERAYTAGLLQNVGLLVLDRHFHDMRGKVAAVARAGYSLIDAEKYTLGMHHAEIGARLATRWELPDVLSDTIRFHHAPEGASVDPVLTAIVHLGETMAAAGLEGDGDEMDGLTYEVCEAALELTNMDPSDFEVIGADLQQELVRARELFKV